MPMPEGLKNLRQPAWLNVFVFLGYLGLTLVMTWPLVTRLGSEIAGVGTDVWIHQWTFWWVKEALAERAKPVLHDAALLPLWRLPHLAQHRLVQYRPLAAAASLAGLGDRLQPGVHPGYHPQRLRLLSCSPGLKEASSRCPYWRHYFRISGPIRFPTMTIPI